jgi:cell shape-determining protein MreC
MHSNPTRLLEHFTRPVAILGAALAVAVVLLLLPMRCTAPIKGAVQAALGPGRRVAVAVRRQAGRVTAWAKGHFHTAAQLAEAQEELRRLESENRRLADELTDAASRPAAELADTARPADDDDLQRLLRVRCIGARVLGHQARAFLQRQALLDVGTAAGVQPDSLVVGGVPGALIDRGSDAELLPDRLVLSGARVWGKIVEVGRYTSAVRTVTEPGYRDLVRLGVHGNRVHGNRRAGPEGILEGTGRPLVRIRLVDVTEPVAVGDPVWTASGKGFVPKPLLYGRVVRLERPVGAAHWDIWMQPAVTPDEVEEVVVLQAELNPLRVEGDE